ncbi:MAG TPA: fructose-6-phosphate aldolase [Acidobacteriota bacterium]|jgi:transaldolase|nr:fructose-6-phosphate aldolase [Acidobacteriota bacterium]
MKIFIDTANLKEIREAQAMGILDGVTTNPSLISKESFSDYREGLKEICKLVPGPVSAEVVGTRFEEMVEEGRSLAKIADNIVVKVPINMEGLKVIKKLSSEGIRINVTLIFSPTQALLSAKAGAAFVSPFIGRLDDIATEGMDLIHQLVTIFDNYDIETEILAASIRHPVHVVQAAIAGADIATMPFNVLDKLLNHPLTDLGAEKFRKDWEKVKK